jgi:hypothetical protein
MRGGLAADEGHMMEHGMRVERNVARGMSPLATAEGWSPLSIFLEEAADEAAGEDASAPPVTDADAFARAIILAICEVGVPAWEGRRTFQRCRQAIRMGVTVRTAFRHAGKAHAIDAIWRERERLFAAFRSADDRLATLTDLPWIGTVTQHRLARRLGLAGPGDSAGLPRENADGRRSAARLPLPESDPAPFTCNGERS